MSELSETKGLSTDPAGDVENRPRRRAHMLANDGIEGRRLLSDDGVPVPVDEVIERGDLVVHAKSSRSVPHLIRPDMFSPGTRARRVSQHRPLPPTPLHC